LVKPLTIIKLGGSVITEKDKPFTERLDIIKRLAKEIHAARQEKGINLIVGHGGGSYPHVPAKEYEVQKGVTSERSYEGIAKVQDAAARLNRIIVRELINAGENAMSIQLSACAIAKSGRIHEMFMKPIEMLLDDGMVPVVYGDVGLDIEKGCCILSTEEIINYMTKHAGEILKDYRVARILVCGRVDGVFTGNPDDGGDVKFIPIITLNNIEEVENYLAESSGIDVTGGMKHKVQSMLELAEHGIESQIINALKPDYVKNAMLGLDGLGTTIRKD
jgi:isopentenyl phosphate kinase